MEPNETAAPASPPVSQVHLVRHGEVRNPTGILYGRLPGYHLSDNGRAMATRLGEWFANIPLAELRTSPLERAQETMEPIAGLHPETPVTLDDRLIEADNRLAGQVFGRHSRALFDPRNLRYYVNPLRPSWGEPYADIASRMAEAVTEVGRRLAPGEQAVLVSHQLPIWSLRLYAEGRRLAHDPRKRQCTLGSVTTFRFAGGRLVGVTYAEPARDLLRDKPHRAFSSGT
ncbi:histidine phosphatase family protein [Brooklawnia cerclae]|uniref:Broad specificity phosphatase PhoE n=1 Tax=Brooklawnia cerclae TaxID=349934 RepID=A0ABX0SC38_9ACTN|nr:broad specificity phosphatase PhoE [Brooklawnia cerclae]